MRRISWTILALAILCSIGVHLVAAVLPFDDAFIIFRYVENILQGRGPVYNAGEQVFGVSSPLYTAWLTLLRGALNGLSLPMLAARGNVLFLVAAGLLIYRFVLRLGIGPLAAALAGGAVLISEGMLRASIGGMESSMYLALMAGALLAVAAHRDITAVLLASLASLTRPEGLLLLGIVVAAVYLDRGAPEGRGATLRPLLGLVPLVLWVIPATIYYGTPVPHSVLAKARPMYALPAGTALDEMVTRAGHWSLDGILTMGSALAGGLGSAGPPLVDSAPRSLFRWVGVALLAWIMWRWWRPITSARPLRLLALPLYFLLLVAFYAVTNPLLFPWYLPLLQCPLIVMCVAAGLRPGRPGLWRRLPGYLALILVLSTAVVTFVYSLTDDYWSLLRYGGDNYKRSLQMEAYAKAAEWVGLNSRPDETVAATEIGIIGYSLDRRILDSCGLVTPAALEFLPVPREERGDELIVMSVGFVRATHPDFVVSLPAYVRPSLLNSPWFSANYELVREVPCVSGNPRFYAVLIFRKRPGGIEVR